MKTTSKKAVHGTITNPGTGPWIRVDGKWYTKNTDGVIVRYNPPKN
ncbi:hypothetical protein [Spirosoma fluviale]|nr:hypothetical protein [Spirosoma fluviale]